MRVLFKFKINWKRIQLRRFSTKYGRFLGFEGFFCGFLFCFSWPCSNFLNSEQISSRCLLKYEMGQSGWRLNSSATSHHCRQQRPPLPFSAASIALSQHLWPCAVPWSSLCWHPGRLRTWPFLIFLGGFLPGQISLISPSHFF